METATALRWAQPIPNSACKLSTYRRRWASVVWLDHHQVLMGHLDADDQVRWERLNTRTDKRHPETAFGPRLTQEENAGNECHRFEPIDVSPNGQWLLGYFDIDRREATPGVLSRGGKKQTWPAAQDIANWLPDGRRFVGMETRGALGVALTVFEVGRAQPSRIRLKGLPPLADRDNLFLLGAIPRGTVVVGHYQEEVSSQLDLYEVPLDASRRAHRVGRIVEIADGIREWQLSPHGDRLIAWGWCQGPGDSQAACLWAGDIEGQHLRRIGRAPWRAQSEPPDLGLTGLGWHPDNRRVSFLYGDDRGYQLYLARV